MRFGADQTHCRSCQELYPGSDLDRYLWCPRCRKAARERGAVWGRVVGVLASLGVAGYLAVRYYLVLDIRPSSRYAVFYVLMLVITYVLTRRITLALVQGFYRSRGSIDRPGQ